MAVGAGARGEAFSARWTLWVVAALAALLAVRLTALHYNATDLFFDEAQYWS
jgi:hypothetical protein